MATLYDLIELNRLHTKRLNALTLHAPIKMHPSILNIIEQNRRITENFERFGEPLESFRRITDQHWFTMQRQFQQQNAILQAAFKAKSNYLQNVVHEDQWRQLEELTATVNEISAELSSENIAVPINCDIQHAPEKQMYNMVMLLMAIIGNLLWLYSIHSSNVQGDKIMDALNRSNEINQAIYSEIHELNEHINEKSTR